MIFLVFWWTRWESNIGDTPGLDDSRTVSRTGIDENTSKEHEQNALADILMTMSQIPDVNRALDSARHEDHYLESDPKAAVLIHGGELARCLRLQLKRSNIARIALGTRHSAVRNQRCFSRR